MSEPVESTRGQTPEDIERLSASPARVFAAGDTVPGLSSWLLERKLGGGGFGEVWLAKHAWDKEQKPRAVKFCTNPVARHKLVTHERNVVVRVMKYAGKHPNIVPLLDCNLDGDVPWLMYEFGEGGTLANRIREWRTVSLLNRLGDVVRTLHAVASALEACHRLDPPLVHRDMKPQNVLLAGAVPHITDFGIGGVVTQPKDGSTGTLTTNDARLPSMLRSAGTSRYASPEQMLGNPPKPRDDVYALGIIAYQMVKADLTAAPGPDANPELHDLAVPSELISLIERSVATNPERRPKDASEWETTLAALSNRVPNSPNAAEAPVIDSKAGLKPESATVRTPVGTTSPEPVRQLPVQAPPRKSTLFWVRGGIGGLLLCIVVVVTLKLSQPEKQPEQPAITTPGPKEEPGGGTGDNLGTQFIPGEMRDVKIANGVKMTFCWIPAGKAKLGSPNEEMGRNDDEPEREWTSPGFWMGKYKVTQAEWTAVMGSNPSHFDGKKANEAQGLDTPQFPVESVSWELICGTGKYDGAGFLQKIDHGGIQTVFGKSGKFRLPHEDEWEYACRGALGNARPFYFGHELNGTQANCVGTIPYGTTTKGPDLKRPTPVGAYEANFPHPWGLCDLHGNVYEWCENLHEKTDQRVRRGGSWGKAAQLCRTAIRADYRPANTVSNDTGFRLCLRLD